MTTYTLSSTLPRYPRSIRSTSKPTKPLVIAALGSVSTGCYISIASIHNFVTSAERRISYATVAWAANDLVRNGLAAKSWSFNHRTGQWMTTFTLTPRGRLEYRHLSSVFDGTLSRRMRKNLHA